MAEEIPKDFDWREYISLHKDLRHFKTKEEAEFHWKRYGRNEGRVYKKSQIAPVPSTFNWKDYINFNEDLADNFDEESVLEHWKFYGYRENRIISKKAFYERYPFFDIALYSQYLKDTCDIDSSLSEDNLIKLFFENPVIFRKIDDKVFHIETLFVKECLVDKIKDERVVELNEMHLCCRPCFERMHFIQLENPPEVEEYYSVIQKRLKKREFKYLVNYNICMFQKTNFYLTIDKIEQFKNLDTLLLVTIRQGFSIETAQKIIEFCKKFKNFVILRFNNDDYLDIPFLYISHHYLIKNNINYKILFTVHSKRSVEQLTKLLEVIDDEISKKLDMMLTKNIYYFYNSERAIQLDLRNFRVISKLHPRCYENKYIRFCAGTIFFARKELFDKLFEIIPISKENLVRFNRRHFTNTMSFSTNLDDVVERMFGILNYFYFSNDFLVVFVMHIDSVLKLEILKANMNMFLSANLKSILFVYSISQPEEVYRSISQSAENFLHSLKLDFLHIERVDNDAVQRDFHKYKIACEVIRKFYFSKFKHFIFVNDTFIIANSSGEFLKEFSNFCRDSDFTGLVSNSEVKYHYQSHMFGCNRIRRFINFFGKFSPSKTARELELLLYQYFSNDSKCYIEAAKITNVNLFFCDNLYFDFLRTDKLPVIKIKRLLFEKIINEKLERKISDQEDFKCFTENIRRLRKEPLDLISGIPEAIYKKLEDENLTYLLKYI
jgi:hypothetical protein